MSHVLPKIGARAPTTGLRCFLFTVIGLTDPGTSYPGSYEEVVGVGKDPEWQCSLPQAFYGHFIDMPIHCQKKAAQLDGFSVEAAFGYSAHEENPTKTAQGTGNHRPPTLMKPTPEEKKRARVLAATQKPSETDNEVFVDRESSLPGVSAESGGEEPERKEGDIGYKHTNKKAVWDPNRFKDCLGMFGITADQIHTVLQMEPYDTDTGLVFSRDSQRLVRKF